MSDVTGSAKLSIYRNVSLLATGVLIQGSETRVYGLILYNVNAAVRYVKLYNSATAPVVGTTTPAITIGVPPTGSVPISVPAGIYFSTGLGIAATTENTDAGTTAPSANEMIVNVLYG